MIFSRFAWTSGAALTALFLGVAACDGRGAQPQREGASDQASRVQVGYTAQLEELEAAQAAGFDYIELRTSQIAELSDADFELARQRIQKLRIPTPVSNYFIPGTVKLTGPQTDTAQQIAYVRRALDRMSQLGVEYTVFGSGGARNYPEGFPKEQAFAQLVDFAKRIAPEAQRRGITLLVEPLRRQESNIINTAREGLAWVKAVDHPNFQLMVDFYHLDTEKEDPAIILEAREYIHHLHLANTEGRVFPKTWEERDYGPFFKALRRAGYAKRISIEANTTDLQADAPAAIRLARQGFDPSFPLE